ncbi:MAG: hypothetical protein JSU65_08670 [Candidatus Zixiibacteriota bacterium]|nr:MAG: hypothetical protein JSU65_08670 [candidate division Zixibacteria bacterium]
MKLIVNLLTLLCLSVLVPGAASSQTDSFGAVDTVWAEVSKIDSLNWSINVSFFNDESVVGMSVPLKMKAGLNRIVADSCIYTGGRAEHFNVRAFRADTAIQCVTLGMIASLTSSKKTLPPGRGRLATIFVSSLIDEPIEDLSVDTTTTNPNNQLEVIADSVQGPPENPTKVTDWTQRKIIPVFVARKSE